VRKILKKKAGDLVEAGKATDEPFGPAPGSLGQARIASLDDSGMILEYAPSGEAPALAPLRLILGFPRPIQANRIFKDLVSLGIADIELTGTELVEKSYLESSFFRSREYRAPLIEGAEQAANPRLPRIGQHWTLKRCLDTFGGSGAREVAATGDSPGADEPDWRGGLFIALHPVPGAQNLGAFLSSRTTGASEEWRTGRAITLAIGSERGWTPGEVGLLGEAGFTVCALGERILKTETASVAAVSLCLASMGRM
jgi:RsmE family RNA methyltransferase